MKTRNIFIGSVVIVILMLITGCGVKSTHNNQEGEWWGRVQFGVVAIGGETTGIVLETNSGSFELEILDPALLEIVEKNDNQIIKVKGLLTVFSGVEVHTRKIIEVKTVILVK